MGWGDGAGKRNGNGFRDGMKIKIMIFSIKSDKFTGFFDKFLKISDYANDCNKRSYHINLSVPHSDMAQKKVFGTRAFARKRLHFLPHRITPAKPHSSIGFDPRICPHVPAVAHSLGVCAGGAGANARPQRTSFLFRARRSGGVAP